MLARARGGSRSARLLPLQLGEARGHVAAVILRRRYQVEPAGSGTSTSACSSVRLRCNSERTWSRRYSSRSAAAQRGGPGCRYRPVAGNHPRRGQTLKLVHDLQPAEQAAVHDRDAFHEQEIAGEQGAGRHVERGEIGVGMRGRPGP